MQVKTENIAKGKWWDEGITLVSGCTRVSEACTNCWSLAMERRCGREGPVTFHPERIARFAKGKPRTIAIWNDCFHENVTTRQMSETFDAMAAWKVICKDRSCDHDDPECWQEPQNTYILLTKRPERMRNAVNDLIPGDAFEFFPGDSALSLAIEQDNWPLKNVILGVTTENQHWLDERVPYLLQTQAACRMISAEPLLSELHFPSLEGIGFIIVGCESGPRRRECKIEWVRSIVEQCKAANVPVWVKAISINGKVIHDMNLFPEDLRVRELPNG